MTYGNKPERRLYHYRAKVTDVYDGDTITVDLDLGRGMWSIGEKVRLHGINTPEIRTRNKAEKEAGKAARDFLVTILGFKVVDTDWEAGDIIIHTFAKKEEGKFGRLLGVVYVNDINVNELMISRGHAIEYHGGKRIKWKDWPINDPDRPSEIR